MIPRLGVNVDHVATVRQARRVSEPDPVTAAALAELAGAGGITVHLREDRRHIQDRDVEVLRQTVQTRLNLEMASTAEMVEIALAIRPDCVTLVPEKRQELTTEGGLNVAGQISAVEATVRRLHEGGIFVSLFVDPDLAQIGAAQKCGADAVEIHTGLYCEAPSPQRQAGELVKIEQAVRIAQQLGLKVHAGHGLNYQNVRAVVALGGIEEFNIGHSIVSRAVLVGMERAVREMVALIEGR